MNHEVWNVASPAWKTQSRTPKVSRSKTELIRPKTIMKRWMSLMFQRCGLETRSGSTLSLEIAMRGQVRQEVVEQDLLGRKRQERQERRRQRHADHVAEVGAGGDRDVFQRVGEGAPAVLDALAQHVQIAAEQDDVGAFAGDIDGFGDRDADIGGMQGRRIVDAVAQIADRVAGALQGADDAFLLLRVDLDEKVGARREVPQRLVLHPGQFSPVSIDVASSPTASAMCAVTWRLSPLITLMAMPSRARFSIVCLRLGLRRIEEHQKAAKDHVALVLAVVVGLRGDAARGQRQNAETLLALCLEDRVEFCARGVIQRHLGAVAVERGADCPARSRTPPW